MVNNIVNEKKSFQYRLNIFKDEQNTIQNGPKYLGNGVSVYLVLHT